MKEVKEAVYLCVRMCVYVQAGTRHVQRMDWLVYESEEEREKNAEKRGEKRTELM